MVADLGKEFGRQTDHFSRTSLMDYPSQIWEIYGLSKSAVGYDTKPFYLHCLSNEMSLGIEKYVELKAEAIIT